MRLTAVTFLPALGALVLLFVPRRTDATFKVGGLAVSLVAFLLSVSLFVGFDDAVAAFQFEEVRAWMPGFGISYHLGIDGISLLLVLLTTFLARGFDLGVIDRAVNGLGSAVVGWAAAMRRLQTGYVVNYALTMLAGAVLVVAFLLSR